MSDTAVEIKPIGLPEQAGTRRIGTQIRLIVVGDDPRPAAEAHAAFSANASDGAPNYYLDRQGEVSQFVADTRAGSISPVFYHGRYLNLNRIALSLSLERAHGAEYTPAQLVTLQQLIAHLLTEHQLGHTALATIIADATGCPRLYPYLPPPPPLEQEIFGAALDPAQELFVALYGESYKPLGGSLNLSQAFPLHAARFNLGAPIGRNVPPAVVVAGRSFNLQPFARDTVFNEGTDYAAVQQLGTLFNSDISEIPLSGLGRSLLEATYRMALQAVRSAGAPLQGRENLEPGWRFHQVARSAGYGPPLSGNYLSDDKRYALQVFAGETLYTPVSDQGGSMTLSATDPADPAYAVIWRETYKVARVPYVADAPLHRRAVELQLGAPLSGPYDATLAGTRYRVQVWALDTLYQGADGQIRRMSELPRPSTVTAWQPKAARTAPPPTPANPLPPIAPPGGVGNPRPNDINWPPRPNFSMLTDSGGARTRALGEIRWTRARGDFITITNGWDRNHITDVQVPQLLKIPGGRSATLKFHRIAAAQLQQLFAAWEAAGLLHLIKTFDGAWVARTIRMRPTVLSNHAYGTAFDINAKWNGLMKVAAFVGQPGSVRELVPLANAHGFFWGGHWNYDGKGASDGMHFEWARPI
jgi:hypothetical protein